ncbi:NUDIX hydrolase [Pseudovibrio japonicus]|uniref:NUDIX hydrolase n=1 Tax=Pseudovibrio japonicus TaxID=366534 RepID=A0ABQ3ESX7_9HYPH|nr:NUDIX hydrolase [Pseudovibrio japonicus]GHB48412.1 NUDIX hydrolase [Pseudovibrio japonicus]
MSTDDLTNEVKVERAEENNNPNAQPLRPKDASTLLILDRREDGSLYLLMGKRHMAHKFMPGKFVFPGGRVDSEDSRVKYTRDYHPDVLTKLNYDKKQIKTESRLRALAIAAIRETYEEAGLFIGTRTEGTDSPVGPGFEAFDELGIQLDLAPLRFVARAITPPGRTRRFDARFFAVWADQIAHKLETGIGPTEELEELQWLPIEQCKELDLPRITLAVLTDLENRLRQDPELSPDGPVPYYYWKNDGFAREEI